MSKSVEQLITALKKEYDIYRDYVDIAKKKKDIIIKGNIKELDHITGLEQDMILNMGKIDKIRAAIIGNLLNELKVKEIANISELAPYLEEEDRVKVLNLKDKLEKVLQEIQELNDLNGRLIQQSLEYINFNLNLMTSASTQGTTYGNRADEKNVKTKPNLFDVKI
ncbi:FlgN protein [Geosporobacter subterraneus DSM 17957]|uniref:FlgN protein n=1 Tax=Geosporobacter subterraneus DSM 17957 TaxID=1121919 RepID=A0A1M6CLK2_9FIRM|nr:flagellar protein FlgN [Geosporobacter subterraneus]SHI61915.1 FlgN protein [Geosporobacter subterraneus DSM 17957]